MEKHVFVICAYRESPYLEACIRSLIGQKSGNYGADSMKPDGASEVGKNIIISTSTPNDFISGMGEKYGIPVHVSCKSGKLAPNCSSHKSGIAGDWNSALVCGRAAGADYVTLAHQDDVYEPEYRNSVLKAAEEALRQGENPQIVFTDYYEIRERMADAAKDRIGRAVLGKTRTKSTAVKCSASEFREDSNRNLEIKRRLLTPLKNHRLRQTTFGKRCAIRLGNAICCPAVTYVMKNIIENPFRENMGSNIDWQLWEELSRQNGSFVYVPEKLMGHRIHENSTTSALIADSERASEDEYMLRKFWPGWAARMLARPYRQAEESNRT